MWTTAIYQQRPLFFGFWSRGGSLLTGLYSCLHISECIIFFLPQGMGEVISRINVAGKNLIYVSLERQEQKEAGEGKVEMLMWILHIWRRPHTKKKVQRSKDLCQ